MKKILFIAALIGIISSISFGQAAKHKPKPHTVKKPPAVFLREKFDPARDPNADLAAAITTASKSGKHIILDIGGEWCSWCVYMDKFLFMNPTLAKLRDENYVWLKINVSPENENTAFLSSYPEIDGYPRLLVLDESGKLIQSQDTSPLEEGKGYNVARFTEFLMKWAPVK